MAHGSIPLLVPRSVVPQADTRALAQDRSPYCLRQNVIKGEELGHTLRTTSETGQLGKQPVGAAFRLARDSLLREAGEQLSLIRDP